MQMILLIKIIILYIALKIKIIINYKKKLQFHRELLKIKY